MPYLFLNCSDGRYSTRRLTDEEGRTSDRAVLVEERIYDAYSRHCDQDTVWQTLWNALDNEQAMRRHEKELQPLEEARRTIEWLKAELDRSQRMEKFYQIRPGRTHPTKSSTSTSRTCTRNQDVTSRHFRPNG